jgi:hypothetical protein
MLQQPIIRHYFDLLPSKGLKLFTLRRSHRIIFTPNDQSPVAFSVNARPASVTEHHGVIPEVGTVGVYLFHTMIADLRKPHFGYGSLARTL